MLFRQTRVVGQDTFAEEEIARNRMGGPVASRRSLDSALPCHAPAAPSPCAGRPPPRHGAGAGAPAPLPGGPGSDGFRRAPRGLGGGRGLDRLCLGRAPEPRPPPREHGKSPPGPEHAEAAHPALRGAVTRRHHRGATSSRTGTRPSEGRRTRTSGSASGTSPAIRCARRASRSSANWIGIPGPATAPSWGRSPGAGRRRPPSSRSLALRAAGPSPPTGPLSLPASPAGRARTSRVGN